MQAHLAEDKPLEELPVADRVQFDVEAIKQFKIVQPAPNADESMFAGIPVFGAHHVALRLPKLADSDPLRFVSFPLSGFREFVGILADRPSRLETARGGFFEIEDLADGLGIPMRDEFDQLTCHYSDATLHCLKNIEWYQADPHYTLKLLGRRCQACKLVVSEDSRKKEKIGGLNGKGIAKAKCPKCQNKFGEISLYGLEDRQAGWAGTSPQPAAAGTAGFKPPSAATEEEAADTADATG
jgi:hypothetical protein